MHEPLAKVRGIWNGDSGKPSCVSVSGEKEGEISAKFKIRRQYSVGWVQSIWRTRKMTVAISKQPNIFHDHLPKPPVPDLSRTLNGYLRYASVLATSPEQYKTTEAYVHDFAKRHGPLLQNMLHALAEEKHNWVNEFWLEDMYLSSRMPLFVFSNTGFVYPTGCKNMEETISFASHFICGAYHFKSKLDRRELPIDWSTGKNGGHALCMEQYWYFFTSYRVPSSPVDKLDRATNRGLNGNEHVVVICNNQFFKIDTVINGKLIDRSEIRRLLSDVVTMAEHCASDVPPIGLVTAVNRDKAATANSQLEQDPVNKDNLETIRSASFLVCLDKSLPINSANNGEKNTAARAVNMLHGNGSDLNTANRWFNKTLQFIFTPDGDCGSNFEHSLADGVVVMNLMGELKRHAEHSRTHERTIDPPLSCGQLSKPKPLSWKISSEVQTLLDGFKEDVDSLVNDLDFIVLHYDGFGKEFPKSKNISPDAFVQVVLQLTCKRCHGHLVSTYESASLRRFRYGRVDNIRAATPEVLSWVNIMDTDNVSREQKLSSFWAAVEKQTQVSREANAGHGIDNHLIALRNLAHKYLPTIPAMFKDPLFEETFRFRLSTSQMPLESLPTGLAFYGPVVTDGYGCGYGFFADRISFIISSMKSCPLTNSARFRNTLEKTLDDMKMFLYNSTSKWSKL